MKIERVKSMPTMQRFLYWIGERNSIHTKKVAGKPKPWTDDEILLKYKFCNVRRIDDKVSQWLLHNWFVPYKDHPNILVACTLARQLNKIESLDAVGFPKVWNPTKVCRILGERAERGLVNYGAAYMVMGTLDPSRPKTEQSVWLICDKVHQSGKIHSSSMEKTWEGLCGFAGLGSFMAGQIVADLRWCVTGGWNDRMRWAPAGPGSIRGANRLRERPLESKTPQPQFIQEISELFRIIRERPEMPQMEMMDFQNCHCEWDKYDRTLWGEGRPKQLYPGKSDTSTLHKKQIDILVALRKAPLPLTRKQISTISGVDLSKIGDYAGPRPATQSEKTQEKWPFKSLTDLGYVCVDTYDVNGRDTQLYCLSESGVKLSKTI